jgi:hypothetical protein
MGRALRFSAFVLAGYAAAATAADAQKPAEPQGAGMKCSSWETKTMAGPKDSVVTTSVLEATADGKGWTLKLANRDPVPERVIAIGGDSMVTEAGPFPSVLRPGQTVTKLRTVAHVTGNRLTGTLEAHYSSGDVFHGKLEGTCKK